jgi:hypothetical protein
MISIARHMDEYDIAQEVRLERKVHKGSFLLLEGDTDIKRFSRFIDEAACSIVNCYGRRKAIAATKMLYDEGFLGALAIIDADFDRITGKLELHEGLVYSAAHDLDLDWAKPNVVARYLAEVGDKAKCDLHGPTEAIVEKILEGLKPVSVARLLNHLGHISYRLSDIDVSNCFGRFSVDLEAYVALVFGDRPVAVATKDAIRRRISLAVSAKEYDLYQLTNGHDFHCALGASLLDDLSSRRPPRTWGSEVEIHLRLAFDSADLKALSVHRDILEWVRDNQPYRILQVNLT